MRFKIRALLCFVAFAVIVAIVDLRYPEAAGWLATVGLLTVFAVYQAVRQG